MLRDNGNRFAMQDSPALRVQRQGVHPVTPYEQDGITLHCGDCREVLATLPDGSVDAVVSDPPYGLSFMGKRWDYDVPSVEVWQQCLRVLKPGGHLLAFAGTRTQHRMACRIEDAGFEIRDMIAWVYGSGFPKSLDVSKAIDKAAGAEREVVGSYTVGGTAAKGKHKGRAAASADDGSAMGCIKELDITVPATEAAKQWQGWHTSLKPALEPVTLARKPLEGTVAANVLQYGTGAINVDGCRVEGEPRPLLEHTGRSGNVYGDGLEGSRAIGMTTAGRWPANLIHDGSREATGILGEEARFFYCPKTSAAERGKGNNHPTVKPIDLMRYLCRMVTPPGGIVLDPFAGSGSTLLAARREGFRAIGIELNPEYCQIIKSRLGEPEEAASVVLEGQRTLF
jgi:DNA modification methylase